jgi:predicted metal-dependent hydrolase
MTPLNNIRPRFVPDSPWPSYSYVPGRFPHPASDPAGHLYGKPPERPLAPDADSWRQSRAYLYGVDLFNFGYYWEAHEVWEGLWHAYGRRGPTADFFRGLIKLAAAGVKVRQGVPAGVASHAARAAAVFGSAAESLGGIDARLFGLRIGDLLAYSRVAEAMAPTVEGDHEEGVKIVFPFVLLPWEANTGAVAVRWRRQ